MNQSLPSGINAGSDDFFTTLQDLQLLPDGADLSNLTGDELIKRLVGIFDYLPEGTTFLIDGNKVSITVPETDETKKAEANRLAEKASQRAKKGEYGKAKDIYRRVLELNPALLKARRDLAMVCVESGDTEDAKDHLIEALRLAPDDAWSYVILANGYINTGDHETARKFLRKALDLKPGDPWALNSLGGSLMEANQFDEALKHFDEAIRSDAKFPNAYFGRAMSLVRQEMFQEASETLEKMFTNTEMQDSRAKGVFQQARSSYLRIQNVLANNKVLETAKLVKELSEEGENRSGYPVIVEEGPLDALIAARIKVAWKHNADHHTLTLREGKMPEILKHHHSTHELVHLFMESEARDRGNNRWFMTTPETRSTAALSLRKDLKRLEQKGHGGEQVENLINELLRAACGFLFNCPLDMLIERRIRKDYPQLKEAQFCGLAQLAHEALQTTMDPKIRNFVPTTIQRINDVLNGVYALFVDELLEGGTDYADQYRRLSTFAESEKLFQIWKQKSESLKPGEEYDLVDSFADFLGMRGWYSWKKDAGFIPPADILDGTKEGPSNLDLLKAKAPASVMFLLDALHRYESMDISKIRAVLVEISVAGMSGLDYASSEKKYQLDSLPGESFSGLHLMCLMYSAGQRLMPGESVGMDLNDEYLQALELYQSKQ